MPEVTLDAIEEGIKAVEAGKNVYDVPTEWEGTAFATLYTLDYIDATNTVHKQHLICESLDKGATPFTDLQPKFDVEIDVNEFKKGTWNPTYDVEGLVRRVHQEIERLSPAGQAPPTK